MHIASCSVYLHYMCVFHCDNFEHFWVCSYCCKLFVIKFFYLLPLVIHSVFGVLLPCAHVTCIGYFLIYHMKVKNEIKNKISDHSQNCFGFSLYFRVHNHTFNSIFQNLSTLYCCTDLENRP